MGIVNDLQAVKATNAAQKRSVPALRVNVKPAGDSEPSRCQDILSRLRGVQSAIQTFPDEPDEELKRFFVLEISPSKLESALQKLRRHTEMKYAETAPPRKLIR